MTGNTIHRMPNDADPYETPMNIEIPIHMDVATLIQPEKDRLARPIIASPGKYQKMSIEERKDIIFISDEYEIRPIHNR